MALMKFFSAYSAGDLVGQQAAPLQIVQRFDGQVRIDRARAVSDQQRKMHHLARLAAFDDERNLGAGLLAHQAVVHRGHRQQAGNRRVCRVDAAIGKNQQRIAGVHGVRSARAQVVERVLQASFAVLSAEQRRQRGRQQIAGRDAAQFLQIAIGQDRMRQLQRVAVLRRSSRMLRSVPM